MVYKVTWSNLAVETYISNIEYLETAFTDKEVSRFINTVKRRIVLIAANPKLGSLTNKRKNIRKTVIHRRLILFYRSKHKLMEIELVRFWGTRQHPRRRRL